MSKVLIIGAGPAGLAAAHELHKSKKNLTVNIFEAQDQVGGISKTVNFNDYFFDLGGHRFFSKIPEVNHLWKSTLKNEFITRNRISRIFYNQKFYDYPLKIGNVLSNLGIIESLLAGMSYLRSKVQPLKDESTFKNWVINRFGKRLFTAFFKTYTEKLWGISCTKIKSEWAAQRIKNISFLSAIISSLPLRKSKTKIKSFITEFQYPKFGPGMMYDQIAKNVTSNKSCTLHKSHIITELKQTNNKWEAKVLNLNTKKTTSQNYDQVISTMPLTSLIKILDNSPKTAITAANKMSFRDFIVVCLVYDKPTILKDTWIYVHDKNVKLGRLQIINNWSPFMVPNKETSSYGAEYFCTEGDKFWEMTDEEIINLADKELKKSTLLPSSFNLLQSNVVRVKKAYPIYDDNYIKGMPIIKEYLNKIEGLQVIGRGGMFKYNNMDHSIYTGMLAARNILNPNYQYDLWTVNQDETYHEK